MTVAIGLMVQNSLKSMPHLLETLKTLEETVDSLTPTPETEATCVSWLMDASLGHLSPWSHFLHRLSFSSLMTTCGCSGLT